MAKRATKRNSWRETLFGKPFVPPEKVAASRVSSYKGYRVYPFGDGWKTSADPESTFDSLAEVKRFINWTAKNPGKSGSAFKRCVAEVSEKGGAYDPRAVCAAAGRKKYGAKKYAAMAKAGQKRKARQNRHSADAPVPSTWSSRYFVHGLHGMKTPELKGWYWTKAEAVKAAQRAANEEGEAITVSTPKRSLFQVAPKVSRSNPAEAAAEVYEEFHGRPSSEVVTVTEKIHYHEHLSAIGDLRSMVVLARDGGRITLSRFKKAILCTNEAKNQLFIRGGDQSVDLRTFGVRTEHEVETLGKVSEIVYFTTKDHLGDEGGTALYFHITGETNENGKRKMVGWAPDLIYHTIDERLEFSGGSYTIEAEGIDK